MISSSLLPPLLALAFISIHIYSTKRTGFPQNISFLSDSSPLLLHQQGARSVPLLRVYTASNSLEAVQDSWLPVVRAARGQVAVEDIRSQVVEKEAARMDLKAIGAAHAVAVVGKGRGFDRTGSGLDFAVAARCLGAGIQREVRWIAVDNLEGQRVLPVVVGWVG
jgi:hypothetical protein